MSRRQLVRVAAPVALLAAVTIGALVAHSALRGDSTRPAATATTRTTVTTTRRNQARKHLARQHVRTYVIRSGDTLGSIAQRLGTTVARLEQLNPAVDPTALRVGEKIRVQ